MVSLNADGTASFSCSFLSSYIGFGTYTSENGELIITTNDGYENKYVFNITENSLIFNAKKSSYIESYKHFDTDTEARISVPDGATFIELDSAESTAIPEE